MVKKIFEDIRIMFLDSEKVDRYLRRKKTEKGFEPGVSIGEVSAKVAKYGVEVTESYVRILEDYIRKAWDHLIIYISDPLLIGFDQVRGLKERISRFGENRAHQLLLRDLNQGELIVLFGTITKSVDGYTLHNDFEILSKISQESKSSTSNMYGIFNLTEYESMVIPSYNVFFKLDEKVKDQIKYEKLENAFIFSRVTGLNNKYSRKLIRGSPLEVEVMCVFVPREIDDVREEILSRSPIVSGGSVVFPSLRLDSLNHTSKEELVEDFNKAQKSRHGVSVSAIIGRHRQILGGDKAAPLVQGTPLYVFSDETSLEQIKQVVCNLNEFCRNVLRRVNLLSTCLSHSGLFSFQEISQSCKLAFKYTISRFLYPYDIHAFMKTTYGCGGHTKVGFILTEKSIKPYLSYIPDPEYARIHGAPHNVPKYVISGEDREAIRPWIVKYVIPQNLDRLVEREEIAFSDFDVEWYNAD